MTRSTYASYYTGISVNTIDTSRHQPVSRLHPAKAYHMRSELPKCYFIEKCSPELSSLNYIVSFTYLRKDTSNGKQPPTRLCTRLGFCLMLTFTGIGGTDRGIAYKITHSHWNLWGGVRLRSLIDLNVDEDLLSHSIFLVSPSPQSLNESFLPDIPNPTSRDRNAQNHRLRKKVARAGRGGAWVYFLGKKKPPPIPSMVEFENFMWGSFFFVIARVCLGKVVAPRHLTLPLDEVLFRNEIKI